jgi:hypothetical protein
MAEVDIPGPAGFEPIEVEVQPQRGFWIRGRVAEARNGRPA